LKHHVIKWHFKTPLSNSFSHSQDQKAYKTDNIIDFFYYSINIFKLLRDIFLNDVNAGFSIGKWCYRKLLRAPPYIDSTDYPHTQPDEIFIPLKY